MSQPKAEQAFFQLLRLSLGREEDFPSGLTGEERQAGTDGLTLQPGRWDIVLR